MKRKGIWMPIVAAALLAGCGTTAPTAEQVAGPRAAIEAARALGAEEIPTARLHLKMAEDQYKVAKALLDEEEYERAKIVLQRAEGDAALAREVARMESTRKAAEVASQEILELQQQTE